MWRTPIEAFTPNYLLLTVKHGGDSRMIWGAISWHGLGPNFNLRWRMICDNYLAILGNHVHPFVYNVFFGQCPIFRATMLLFTLLIVLMNGLKSMKMN